MPTVTTVTPPTDLCAKCGKPIQIPLECSKCGARFHLDCARKGKKYVCPKCKHEAGSYSMRMG
jgi:predicted amidophosphoribosyltransferase